MSIFLIFGSNNSLIEEKINELSNRYKVLTYNNNFNYFFSELQKITNYFLWDGYYDIILKNIDKLQNNEIDLVLEFIKNSKNNFILVFSHEPIDFVSKLRKENIKQFKIFALHKPSRKNLEEFLQNYFLKRKIRIKPALIKILQENYKDNFDLLLKDLEKISILLESYNNNDKIILSVLHFQTDAFKIQNYFLERNWPEFIHNFKKFILDKNKDKEFKDTKKDDNKQYSADKNDKNKKYETFYKEGNKERKVLQILSFLTNTLLNIYLIKLGKVKKIKAHTYYLQSLKEKSQNLSINEIKLLIAALAKTDRKFKKFYIHPIEIPEDISLNYLLEKS